MMRHREDVGEQPRLLAPQHASPGAVPADDPCREVQGQGRDRHVLLPDGRRDRGDRHRVPVRPHSRAGRAGVRDPERRASRPCGSCSRTAAAGSTTRWRPTPTRGRAGVACRMTTEIGAPPGSRRSPRWSSSPRSSRQGGARRDLAVELQHRGASDLHQDLRADLVPGDLDRRQADDPVRAGAADAAVERDLSGARDPRVGALPRFPRSTAVAIYFHLSTSGAVLVSGFWSMVNERFDVQSAKRHIGRDRDGRDARRDRGRHHRRAHGGILRPNAILLVLAGMQGASALLLLAPRRAAR